MPNSPGSSTGSAPSRRMPDATPVRIDWRPSRWMVGAQMLLGMLAAVALLTCELPYAWGVPAALLALGYGALLAKREASRPARHLVIAGTGASLDGQAVRDPLVRWRGPLAFFDARDGEGRRLRLSWWPDTLPPARRRELRLAMAVQAAASSVPEMAP